MRDTIFRNSLTFAKFLDEKDPLSHLRKRFYLKDDIIYLSGNSLGLASVDAEESLVEAFKIWKENGVMLWYYDHHKYLLYSNKLAELMAPLVGCDAEEIACTGSTTVNIHQAISTFYKPTESKYKILVDNQNFSTDRYAIDSQVRLKGLEPEDIVKIVKPRDGTFMNEEDIIEAMTDDVALVFLPGAYYKTSQLLDIRKISEAAKSRQIVIGWDLSHVVGIVEIDFRSMFVDFAVWCTYKYLNGGPGSAAGLYINKKHFNTTSGLNGWMGNRAETRFCLRQEYEQEKEASGWQIGTPSIFSMATLEGSLKVFQSTNIASIRKKSLEITAYLMYLIETKLKSYGFSIGNPREDRRRGGHICLEHYDGFRISLALKACGIVSDFREPNVIRLSPNPLYTRYTEVFHVVDVILHIVRQETYKKFSDKRNYVI